MSSSDLPVFNAHETNTPTSIFYSKFEINKCACVLCSLKLNPNNFITNPEDNTKFFKWSHEKLIQNYQGLEFLDKLKKKIHLYMYSLVLNCPLPDIYFDIECRLGCHINLFIIDHINKNYKNENIIKLIINNNISDYIMDRLIIIFNGFFEIFYYCIKLNKVDYLINFMKRYKYVINKNNFLEKWYEMTVKHLQCKLPLVIRAFNESYGPGTYDIYFEHYFECLINACAKSDY